MHFAQTKIHFSKKTLIALALTLSILVLSLCVAPLGAHADTATATPPPTNAGSSVVDSIFSFLSSPADTLIGGPLQFFGWVIFTVSSWGVLVAGYLLDLSIQASITADTYNKITAIGEVWSVVRDFANIFFLFGLLYIAISTILNLGNNKRFIAPLIVMALLVNFSLFLTKVVIDAANIFTLYFWQSASAVSINGVAQNSISSVFMNGFALQTIVNQAGLTSLSHTNTAVLYFLGAGGLLVTAFVFLAGAFMFITRTIALIILMVLSPLAFVAMALPGMGGKASQWWSSLISYSFFAPAYMFFIYLVAKIASGGQLAQAIGSNAGDLGTAFLKLITGEATQSDIAPIFGYLLVIGLLLASIKAADSIAHGISGGATKWAKRGMALGYGTVLAGGSAMALRNTAGRGFHAAANSKWMQEWASNSVAGRAAYRVARGGASASYNVANLKTVKAVGKATGVNLKESGKGGFTKKFDAQVKHYEEEGKSLKEEYRGDYAQNLQTGSTRLNWWKFRQRREAAKKVAKKETDADKLIATIRAEEKKKLEGEQEQKPTESAGEPEAKEGAAH